MFNSPWSVLQRFLRRGRGGMNLSTEIDQGTSSHDYSKWSRDDLIKRIEELDGQNKTEIIKKEDKKPDSSSSSTSSNESNPSKNKTPSEKPFNWDRYTSRHIALKIAYFGWHYNGLARQGSPTPLPTVEEKLFEALKKAKLIKSPETCNFSRSGRTDRGVSAVGQVVSLKVRSLLDKEYIKQVESKLTEIWEHTSKKRKKKSSLDVERLTDPKVADEMLREVPKSLSSQSDENFQRPEFPPPPNDQKELPYVTILNRLLPPSIRVLAWAPVPPEFDARFDCLSRKYKYFFPRTNLDIEAMHIASKKLIGLHDFRNFCKVDASKQLTHWDRYILDANIQRVTSHGPAGLEEHPWDFVVEGGIECDLDMFVLNVHGSAFLWHQIRCIVAILFLVGRHLEDPSVIDLLLDTKGEMPSKPSYEIAHECPLVLMESEYDRRLILWQSDTDDELTHPEHPELTLDVHEHIFRTTWSQYAETKSKITIMELFVTNLLNQPCTEETNRIVSNSYKGRIRLAMKSLFYNTPGLYRYDEPPTSTRQAWVYYGAGKEEYTRNYVPLAKRKRHDPPEVQNERYRLKVEQRGKSLYLPKYARDDEQTEEEGEEEA